MDYIESRIIHFHLYAYIEKCAWSCMPAWQLAERAANAFRPGCRVITPFWWFRCLILDAWVMISSSVRYIISSAPKARIMNSSFSRISSLIGLMPLSLPAPRPRLFIYIQPLLYFERHRLSCIPEFCHTYNEFHDIRPGLSVYSIWKVVSRRKLMMIATLFS